MAPLSFIIAMNLVVCLFGVSPYLVNGRCETVNTCSCESSTDGVIDLANLASTDWTKPAFENVDAGDNKNEFSWNPCYDFDQGEKNRTECVAVSACRRSGVPPFLKTYSAIGLQRSAEFTIKWNRLVLSYSYQESENVTRITDVYLDCDENLTPGNLTAKYINDLQSELYYTGIFACYRSTGLSAGSIILIVFFSLIAVYLIVGMAYQKFGKKATGMEIIPNSECWCAIPVLIQGGFKFMIQPCTKREKKYDNI